MIARLSVYPSVRMEKHGSDWTYFYEMLYISIFRKSLGKIQIYLKSHKNLFFT